MGLYVDIQKKVKGFSLEVAFETHGGTLGMLGESGSGKSMTLRCIAGIERPDKGKIVLDGKTLFDSAKKINLPPQCRRVGYLFQHYALFPHMTVGQNILCGLHGDAGKGGKAAALREILRFMQLEGLEQRRPAQLSGGEQQRVALARILVNQPDLLMLDEPFSALDSHLRDQLHVQMQGLLRQFDKSVLLVTHSRSEAYRLSGEIALIHGGSLLLHKKAAAVLADPGSRQAAVLTGWKNVAEARKTGECEVEVPAWGIRLATSQPAGTSCCGVAIQDYSFRPRAEGDGFPVHITAVMEERLEYIMQFRFVNQAPDAADLWWRVPKDSYSGQAPGRLGVEMADILLLTQ